MTDTDTLREARLKLRSVVLNDAGQTLADALMDGLEGDHGDEWAGTLYQAIDRIALATLSKPEPAAVGHRALAVADILELSTIKFGNVDQVALGEEAAILIRSLLASPSESISPPDGPIATELDGRSEAMVCTGCGTTKTVAFIKANSPTAFTCCPERKMIPVRDLWSNAIPPDARAVVEALDELDGSDFEAVRRHSATLRAALQSGASK